MSCQTPIAFLIFRRPDLTTKVFEAIREAKPHQLFIVADGGRNQKEILLCEEARKVTESIDWDCEVFRNYSEENLGCRKRISSGLDWVFSQVDQAIILEDDCLPHPSFFRYCQELLEYYRHDQRIWCISGNNFQDGQRRGDGSYYFSNYPHCWGWATWRRAWHKYDRDLTNWPAFRDGQHLKGVFNSEQEANYWQNVLERLYETGQPNSWAYVWGFTCWQNSGLSILPNVNLVSNIGFRMDADHTTQESNLANLAVSDIGIIKHPDYMVCDQNADTYSYYKCFGGARKSIFGRIYTKFKLIFSGLTQRT
ncbi:MAG: glycosyltransferase family 2 protein [Pseudanabaenaceae cyanobacterium bins.68]|nr:glycosyltransferase family 2 protein [Pseudanabaenaceae cyanobacterium bins.68]